MFWFAFASLAPAALLVAACLWGGVWPGLAVAAITLLVFVMDRLVARRMPDMAQDGDQHSGLWLSYWLGIAHFGLWGLGLWAIGSNGRLDTADKVLLVIGLGLYFGQISNSNAHELIHNAARAPRRLGIAIYGSLLFAHHTSAHMRVHHVWAGTLRDPSTARLGEGFWRYLVRAWAGGFAGGKRAEDLARRAPGRDGRARPVWTHPYVAYVALSLGFMAAAMLLGGRSGVAALLVIAAYAQIQLYLSDYVQHYGLVRAVLPTGKPEPIGPQHSWNAPQWYSSAMMLHAPRHSDHHVNPSRPFPALALTPGQMPMLPHSLPVMAVLALVPPLWRRLMDKRARRWRDKPMAAGKAEDRAANAAPQTP